MNEVEKLNVVLEVIDDEMVKNISEVVLDMIKNGGQGFFAFIRDADVKALEDAVRKELLKSYKTGRFVGILMGGSSVLLAIQIGKALKLRKENQRKEFEGEC